MRMRVEVFGYYWSAWGAPCVPAPAEVLQRAEHRLRGVALGVGVLLVDLPP